MIFSGKKDYSTHYAWSHPLGDYAIAHDDGAVSQYLSWSGVDYEMLNDDERDAEAQGLLTALKSIPLGYCAEFHSWREYDRSMVNKYLERELLRGSKFVRPLREDFAEHIATYAMTNQVGVVLCKEPLPKLFKGAKYSLKQQSLAANELLDQAESLVGKLPGGQLMTQQSYYDRILQSYDRRRYNNKRKFSYHDDMFLSEQIIAEAPDSRVTDCIRIGGEDSSVLLLYLYPDAYPGWSMFLASLSIPLHVSFILKPIEKKRAMRASESDSKTAKATSGQSGVEEKTKTLSDLGGFRSFVEENNVPLFQTCFIIHLHGTSEQNKKFVTKITDEFEQCGGTQGQIREQNYVQRPFWRVAQPGQGYRAPLFRPDEGSQVANMLPHQVYRQGKSDPQTLRLGAAGQTVGVDRLTDTVAHSGTLARSGSGKGVLKVAEILELYPLGMNYHLAEMGPTYEWVVLFFGGSYTRVDPKSTILNPLPLYSMRKFPAERPLPVEVVGATIGSLAFLLTDGRTELTAHENSAAQSALQLLYAVAEPGVDAPTLVDFHDELEHIELELKEQSEAAKMMANNLYSFLSTTEGRIFTGQSNLQLSGDICGVNLQDVEKVSPQLLKFYMIFLGLQFSHVAFSSKNTTTILFDELHKFIKIAPKEIGKLISELARMGRKEAAIIDLVTQEAEEIDAIENAVLNSMEYFSLLYRKGAHEELVKRIEIPEGPAKIWRNFRNPLYSDFRPALQSVGDDFYNLHLTFPQIILDLADSSKKGLDLKKRVLKESSDPHECLRLFRAYKEGRL